MLISITFGREDGTAVKKLTFKSRNKALMFANNLAFVMFKKHPFKNSTTGHGTKYDGNGFYVQYDEFASESEYRAHGMRNKTINQLQGDHHG